jgi:CheY-like chemotaxis protein
MGSFSIKLRTTKTRMKERPDLARRADDPKGDVLIVEDEPLILLELQHMLSELGWVVTHFASDIEKAIDIAQTEKFDIAILDVNVKGQTSFAVAEVLRNRNVPVVLATGYSTEIIVENYPGAIFLQKPYLKAELAEAITEALAVKAQMQKSA